VLQANSKAWLLRGSQSWQVEFKELLLLEILIMTLEGRGVIVVLHLADVSAVEGVPQKLFCVKVAKYETQKPLTCRATLFRCKFWVDVSRFFTLRDQPVAQR